MEYDEFMNLLHFILRAAVYILCFILSIYGLSALNYEKALRKDHVKQAQVLYVLLALGLAYLAGSFINAFLYFD